MAKPHRTEVDVEESAVNLFEPDVVAGEKCGDEDSVGVPADPAVARDEASLEMPRVGDGPELHGKRAWLDCSSTAIP